MERSEREALDTLLDTASARASALEAAASAEREGALGRDELDRLWGAYEQAAKDELDAYRWAQNVRLFNSLQPPPPPAPTRECPNCGMSNPLGDEFCRGCGFFLELRATPPQRDSPRFSLTDDPIRYRVGNEHNPMDPFGRVDLKIEAPGDARLAHVSRTGGGTWTATVRPETLDGLRTAIAAAGFPDVPVFAAVPDSEVRTLAVGAAGVMVVEQVAKLPAWADVFKTLDAIADEMSGGTVRRRPLTGESLVTSIRPA